MTKIFLLQEVHHRVKNNLAIISGLLELQILRGDAHPQLIDTKNRIHSIAGVHEQLYGKEAFSHVDPEKYFSSLINRSKKSFLGDDQHIKVNFENRVPQLNINEAIPMGLLLNELITNSVKYAFDKNKGSINIKLIEAEDNKIHFSYTDSGSGFDRSKLENNEGFGLELIKTLIAQLSSEYILITDGSFQLKFEFDRKSRGSYSNL